MNSNTIPDVMRQLIKNGCWIAIFILAILIAISCLFFPVIWQFISPFKNRKG